MDVREAAESRFSCRAFLDTPVPEATVREILERAGRAPSGGNVQPWNVHVLTGAPLAELKRNIAARPNELPFGEGKRWLNRHRAVDAIVGGWQLAPIVRWQSGAPLSIIATRGTFNRTTGTPTRSSRQTAVTSLTRTPIMRDLPTVAESGLPGFEAISWFGLLAPAGTPVAIVSKVYQQAAKIALAPEMKATLAQLGLDVTSDAPDALGAIIKADIAKWAKVIKEANIKAEQ